jgi:hypothetical protein
MRTRVSLAVVATVGALVGAQAAQAQTLINPYATTPAAPTTVVEPAQPIDPYAYPYGSGTGAYPAPVTPATPSYPSTAPPVYQNGYWHNGQFYPTQPQPYTPPTVYTPPTYYYSPAPLPRYTYSYYYGCGAGCVKKPVAPREKIRRFSIGVHGTALGINQQVGGKDVVLGGAGLQLRIRSKGRFGLELKQDFLGASFLDGQFERTSLPFTFSLMLYIFPNQETRHFNLYFLAGFGGMWDQVKLIDQNGRRVRQDFLEGIGQLGLGAELRWRWFAIAADARALGLIRDSSSPPGSYYGDIDGAPIPKKSWGIQGNVYVNLWF